MDDQRQIQILEALFDEGANFADYAEGKMGTQPDGYDHQNLDVAEVRGRAVKRARDALGAERHGGRTSPTCDIKVRVTTTEFVAELMRSAHDLRLFVPPAPQTQPVAGT